ncbi:MAG: class A beta-lactamase-related serine hydrolase [Alphaproteobacteria bacterium]|nr:MAG: class A beta-lactamase-related serine hydrolase [Alphaproteobacteria bacterium]
MCLRLALALLILFLPAQPGRAEVDTEALARSLQQHNVSHETVFVTTDADGLTAEARDQRYMLGDAGQYVLALATLRLVDRGLVGLDNPVSGYLPDIVEKNPFRVAVTVRHILAGTAGYAVPPARYMDPGAPGAPLRAYAIEMRTAGQAASEDPVAWAILVQLLEHVAGKPIADIVADEVDRPLGLVPGAHTVPAAGNNGGALFAPVYGQTATGDALATLVKVLLSNRGAAGAPYLSEALNAALVTRSSFRLHPLAPAHMLGVTRHFGGGLSWLAVGDRCDGGAAAMVFTNAQVAFVRLPDGAVACGGTAWAPVYKTARDLFPTEDQTARTDAAANLAPPSELGGRYVATGHQSDWLQARLLSLELDYADLTPRGDDLVLSGPGPAASGRVFSPGSPYFYESRDGTPLVLSPYRLGGYMLVDGQLFRFVGAIGDPRYVIKPFPWVVLVLLSSIAYIRSRTDRAWRFMAGFGFAGTLMILAGLWCEWNLWPEVVYGEGRVWLVTLWRLVLNAGLMLVLTLPLFCISFQKRGLMPQKGVAFLIAVPHLLALMFAALAMLAILSTWGLAGTFTGP